MDFEWDDLKNESNIAKHGISFSMAATVFDDPFIIEVIDNRIDYGEERWIAIGELNVDGVVVCVAVVVWTNRDRSVRIISARKANKREVRRYEDLKP